MRNAKRFLAGTLAAATAMSMMTCAQMTVSADEEISGTIEVGGWPSGDDAFEAAMEGFNEQYPNVEVELVFTDTTAHHQSLQTALAAGFRSTGCSDGRGCLHCTVPQQLRIDQPV